MLEHYLRTTLASIGDAVISTDTEGTIVFANRVARSLLRAEEPEIIGKPLGDVFRIHNEFTGAEVESPIAKVLRDGATVEARESHSAGCTRWNRNPN